MIKEKVAMVNLDGLKKLFLTDMRPYGRIRRIFTTKSWVTQLSPTSQLQRSQSKPV